MQLIKNTAFDVTELENKKLSEIVFDSYNIESMNIFALLFQTGYLTITDIDQKTKTLQYTLNYPNFEVKEAFVTYLFESFTQHGLESIQPMADELRLYLQNDDLEGFMNIIRALFAKIPYSLHIEQESYYSTIKFFNNNARNSASNQNKPLDVETRHALSLQKNLIVEYYHSLFYMIAVLMGVEIDLEVLTDKGRVDGVLDLSDKIYLMEFKYGKTGKMDTLTQKAIKQIKDKNYAQRFLNDARPLYLLGVGFIEKEIGYLLEKANKSGVGWSPKL